MNTRQRSTIGNYLTAKRLRTGMLSLGVGSLASVLAWQLARIARKRATSATDTHQDIEPELVAAITIAVLAHRKQTSPHARPTIRPVEQTRASCWVVAGRMRQNHDWHPRTR